MGAHPIYIWVRQAQKFAGLSQEAPGAESRLILQPDAHSSDNVPCPINISVQMRDVEIGELLTVLEGYNHAISKGASAPIF